jgi:hypothetical protein
MDLPLTEQKCSEMNKDPIPRDSLAAHFNHTPKIQIKLIDRNWFKMTVIFVFPCPVDGGYTDWSQWDTCTVTCGGGSQERYRNCTNPVPQYGGADCMGVDAEIQVCNMDNCPSKICVIYDTM